MGQLLHSVKCVLPLPGASVCPPGLLLLLTLPQQTPRLPRCVRGSLTPPSVRRCLSLAENAALPVSATSDGRPGNPVGQASYKQQDVSLAVLEAEFGGQGAGVAERW